MSIEKNLKNEINNFTNMFNTVCKDIGAHLVREVPKNRNIHIYNKVVCDLMKDKPEEAISVFLVEIYDKDNYKKSILEGDEDFFMNNNHQDLAGNSPNGSDIVSQVKGCWNELGTESKFYIKKAFKMLIKICDKYVDVKVELNKVKK